MEFDDFKGIEQVSPSPEEILAGVKGWFHDAMLEDPAIVGIVSARLDEEKDSGKYLDGTIQLEPIYYVDNDDNEHYGISLTRHIGKGKWVMAQPDPLIIGSIKSATTEFSITPEFASLLQKAEYLSEEGIANIINRWQRATKVFYDVMPDEIAPDPTCYNTFRLKEENQSIIELQNQISDDDVA
jgi:hypothetical protein